MKKIKIRVREAGVVLVGFLAAVAFAVDTDTDGMADGYEQFFGLNYTNNADAVLDLDGDSLINLQESVFWTDPFVADTDRDGWADHLDDNPLSRAVFLWGDPQFTMGSSYFYTGPLWWSHAFQNGGGWSSNGWEAAGTLGSNMGSLNIQVLRGHLTNNAMLDLELFDATNASLYVSLYDTNEVLVADNLYGNLMQGSEEVVTRRLDIPFSAYGNASVVRLWRGVGDVTVYGGLMYIDSDRDGLDADQELQAGTSDVDPDSDNDGLTDYTEIMLTGTDPLDPDTDGDGLSDAVEVDGSVYRVVDGTFTWEEARLDAEAHGGHLFTLSNDAEHQALITAVGEEVFSASHLWIGAFRSDTNVVDWQWVTGEEFLFSRWGSSPVSAALWGYYDKWLPQAWKASKIWGGWGYILELENFSDPLLADTDGDGLSDADEILHGCDARIADTDGDTLSDGDEIEFGGNPLEPDTDFDGYTDAQEAGISDLNDPNSIPVSEVAVSGSVAYDGLQTGAVHIVAATSSTGWAAVASMQIATSGAFTVLDVPVFTEFWLKAWMDSNGDGLPDPWEAQGMYEAGSLSLTAPFSDVTITLLESDQDNDGLADWRELEAGTDVLLADTDGDGLSDAVEVDGSVYRVVDGAFIWEEARLDAEAHGGHLFTLSNDAEHQALVDAVGEEVFSASHLWIGAFRSDTNAVDWQWVTGEEFLFSRWGSSPVSAALWGYYDKWLPQAWKASKRLGGWGYILELENFSDPLLADTDGDGLSDADEILHGCNARIADTDGDTLNDGDEVAQGLDPNAADSDDDGLDDAFELALGTNPLLPDSDGDGLSDGEEMGFRYQISRHYLTWDEARLEAVRRGSYLAVITTDGESDTVCRLFGVYEAFYEESPWIGLSLDPSNDEWTWVNQAAVETTRWSQWAEFLEKQDAACYAGKNWDAVFRDTRQPWLMESDRPLDPLNPDTDADGLPDGQELLGGTDPFCADTDGDGLGDSVEIAQGTDPTYPDTDRDGISDADEPGYQTSALLDDADGDGLLDGEECLVAGTDPHQSDSNTNGVPDSRLILSIAGTETVGRYASHIASVWSDLGDGRLALSSIRPHEYEPSFVTYDVQVDNADGYRFAVQFSWQEERSDDLDDLQVDLYVDGQFITSMPVVQRDGAYPESYGYIPWLLAGSHNFKLFVHGRTPRGDNGIVIDALELYAIDGADADGNGMQDWVETLLFQGLDTDGDGISDFDEITLYHTDPLDADSDSDGLSDGDELLAGTDPLDEDSDNDGVQDGEEIHKLGTDPLNAEFDGTVTTVVSVAGSQTNNVVGTWEIQGSELVSKSSRGSVEYTIDFPAQDIYGLNITVAHIWRKSSCTPVVPVDTSHLQISVDGTYIGSYPLVSADGVYIDVRAFLPILPVGQHTIRIFWENTSRQLAVKINELQLQSLGGSDADGNGIKDWVETSIASMAGVDPVTESVVSPACIEGDARYIEFMSLTGGTTSSSSEDSGDAVPPSKGVGSRWYANLLLEQDGTTVATASFQSGALEVPISIDWIPYNLMEHADETLFVRKGDMVKFVALPDEAVGGQFEIEYVLDMDGETVRSPNTGPLIYLFPSAGTYTVSGQYTHGNDIVTATIQVQVIDGSFSGESPACLVGRTREWSIEGIPGNAVLEVDSSVELSELSTQHQAPGTDQSTTNQSLRTVSLKANKTNGDHIILARLYPGGPVLDSARLETFWVQNATDGYFYTIERYEDSELWEIESIAKNLPDSVDLHIKVIVGGVTLDDYTLERWLTRTAYDEIGSYKFSLFHPNDASSSTCHTFKLYQDGIFLGAAFSGGQNDIEE